VDGEGAGEGVPPSQDGIDGNQGRVRGMSDATGLGVGECVAGVDTVGDAVGSGTG
jgi:hypothetical protein